MAWVSNGESRKQRCTETVWQTDGMRRKGIGAAATQTEASLTEEWRGGLST